MLRRSWLRFALEATFLILVAVAAGLLDLHRGAIIAVMAVAWLLVALVEWAVARPRRRPVAAPPAVGGEEVEAVVEPEPEPAEESEDAVEEPEPEPEPVVEVEPEREPEPVPVGAETDEPQEWNLWELDRLSREAAGTDVGRDEERSFLLVYLREFAGPDGTLPRDFDGLVRDSFGDLIAAASR